MFRKIALFAMIALIALALGGCMDIDMEDLLNEPEPDPTPVPPLTEPMIPPEEEAALYKYYNEVSLSDTITTLKARYGEPEVMETENGNVYLWVMEDGYGFSVGVYENGKVRGKVLHIQDMRQLGLISKATNTAGVTSLTKDYNYPQCKAILGGKPMQVMITSGESSANPQLSALYAWVSERGDVVQIVFNSNNRVESYYYLDADTVETP